MKFKELKEFLNTLTDEELELDIDSSILSCGEWEEKGTISNLTFSRAHCNYYLNGDYITEVEDMEDMFESEEDFEKFKKETKPFYSEGELLVKAYIN